MLPPFMVLQQADPDSLQNQVLELRRRVDALQKRYVHANAASELVDVIGNLDYRAVDSQGRLRMIMSAVSLLEEFGIDAHLAGFNENRVPEVWIGADQGNIVAMGGDLSIDHNGITDSSSLNAIRSGNTGNYSIVGRVWYHVFGVTPGAVFGVHTFVFISDTARFTDDFEDGTLNKWVTSGSPSVQTDDPVEGKYYARISTANTIAKTLNATIYGANQRYFVTCLYRRRSGTGGGLQLDYGGSSTIIHSITQLAAMKWYRAYFVFQANNDTTPTLTFSNFGSGDMDIDDVFVQELTSPGIAVAGGSSGQGVLIGNPVKVIGGFEGGESSPITTNMLTRDPDSVGQGTWARAISSSYFYCGDFYNSSNANGDNFTVKFHLPAGTYKLRFNSIKHPTSAIVKVEVGSTNLGNTDLYAAAGDNTFIVEYTGCSITAGGEYAVKFSVNGRNASATGWYLNLSQIEFIRTA